MFCLQELTAAENQAENEAQQLEGNQAAARDMEKQIQFMTGPVVNAKWVDNFLPLILAFNAQ